MIKKKILFILTIVMIALAGCEGPVGPQGEAGEDGVDGVDGTDGSANMTTWQRSWDGSNIFWPPNTIHNSTAEVRLQNVSALTASAVQNGVVIAHFNDNNTVNQWIALPYSYKSNGDTIQLTYWYTNNYFELWFINLDRDITPGQALTGRVKLSIIPPTIAAKQKSPDLMNSAGYQRLLDLGVDLSGKVSFP